MTFENKFEPFVLIEVQFSSVRIVWYHSAAAALSIQLRKKTY